MKTLWPKCMGILLPIFSICCQTINLCHIVIKNVSIQPIPSLSGIHDLKKKKTVMDQVKSTITQKCPPLRPH